MTAIDPSLLDTGIAIVGLSARLPGARSVDEYWSNLRNGVESLKQLSESELLENGVSQQTIDDPNYVPVSGCLPDVDLFDAGYFGFSPMDAAITDPQHRHFLECTVEAFEIAGYSTHRFEGGIGVFAGCGMNSYFVNNLLTNSEMMKTVGAFLLRHTGNDRDFLPTTVSYKLDLRGPSMAIQTACSTSLVAIHTACQSLLAGECEMAVAGGSTILVPNGQGYFYRDNEPVSPDGHCRPFEENSAGTVLGSGVGVVILRRLEDAINDGDTIQAVIRGSAVNNDGAGKVGYLAPSVEGHAGVVAEALAVADVSAGSISYVEAHGTGTRVGDPIEIAALTKAFRASTDRTEFCRIGSVKSNIGHLDTAAGVASLIKVVKSLQNKEMAPTLHFEKPNPEIDFTNSPFVVNAELRAWEEGTTPRRAGVSSLGIGGTNAHVILEEAPALPPSDGSTSAYQILTLSAKSRSALDAASLNLAAWLRTNNNSEFADVAFTLQEGRDYWDHRLVVTAAGAEEAAIALEAKTATKVSTNKNERGAAGIAFMFSGAGGQYPNMGRDLYEHEPVFRAAMDQCFKLVEDLINYDLKALIYPIEGAEEDAGRELQLPSRLCPAVVVTEWSLAQLWKSWGIEPTGMIGHSLGEYVAACLAEVFTLKEMLYLVVLRGKLIDGLSGGAMLSLPMSETEAHDLIGDDLDLAAVNSPGLCVISGALPEVKNLQQRLASMDIEARLIPVNAAGHSRHLDPILEEFRSKAASVKFSRPKIPYISNVTGTWASEDVVANPDYWVKHLRGTVRFSDGVQRLIESDDIVLLEVGPGQGLCTFARQQADKPLAIVPSMRKTSDNVSDQEYLLGAFGKLWAGGYDVDWQVLRDKDERRRRIPLPTYPFEHKPFWIEPGKIADQEVHKPLSKLESKDDWFQGTGWLESPILKSDSRALAENWLVFLDSTGVGKQVVENIKNTGGNVVTVVVADTYFHIGENEYALAPELGREGYEQLISALVEHEKLPQRVLHLWGLTPDKSFRPGSSFLDRTQECGFYSLLFFMQTLADSGESVEEINVVANGMFCVGEDENVLYPEKATLLGPIRVIPREFPDTQCRYIDIDLAVTKSSGLMSWVGLEGARVDEEITIDVSNRIFSEIKAEPNTSVVAWRGARRFKEALVPTQVPSISGQYVGLKNGGVYLVTGGLGGVGFALAEHIATKYKARMVLIGRSAFPAEENWEAWLDNHTERDGIARKIGVIQKIREAGGDVMVFSTDVTDSERMEAVISEATHRFGSINGVLHAAASVSDGVLQTKTKDGAEKVFSTKLYGTLVLDRLFTNINLDFFLLFSSTSAIVGLPGQIDYAGANAFLNVFAEQRNRSGKRTLALDWGIWNGVGGATELALTMLNEPVKPDYGRATSHKMLGECTHEESGIWRWNADWRPQDIWVLDEHRNEDNVALLPGTAYLEIARAAFADALHKPACHIYDVAFLQPLAVDDDEACSVFVEMRQKSSGYELKISSRGSENVEEIEHAFMTLSSTSGLATKVDIATLSAHCKTNEQIAPDGEVLPSSQEAQLGFGPRWACLKSIGYGENEAFAELRVDAKFGDDFEALPLHPGMLDIGTSFGIPLVNGWQAGEAIYVPLAYGSVTVYGPLQPRMFAHIVNDPENDFNRDVASFQVTIVDAQGNVLVDIDNYQMRKLEANSGFGSLAERTSQARNTRHESSPIEKVFLESYDSGIQLEEGVGALERSLEYMPGGVTVISPINIVDWRGRITSACASNSVRHSVTFARPDLDSEYEAPRDDVESALVRMWQEFLGVDQIGIHDDFFDLGGHSLIAVRLFAKLKKEWGVDWPISTLFDASSIGRFATLLSEEIGVVESSSTTTPDVQTAFKHRFLVNLNRVNSTSRQPLFLVAGMFGNVLNLRHLATHLGDDQPVYALQAKGLYGEDEPHYTFKDAACDYIAEMRQVQPHGPYMIGGFSGGGVTAFEIAHQLLALGEEVSAVVMLDSIPPHPAWPEPGLIDRLRIQSQRWRKQVLRNPLEWLKGRIRWEIEKRGMQPTQQERTPAEFRSDLIEIAFRTSLSCYDMRVLPLKLSLFRPHLDSTYNLGNGRVANADGQLMENENWWAPWTNVGVEIQIVQGNHDSMVLEPNVKLLAAFVRQTLDDAQPEIEESVGKQTLAEHQKVA